MNVLTKEKYYRVSGDILYKLFDLKHYATTGDVTSLLLCAGALSEYLEEFKLVALDEQG
jgi:hypothetical protein